MLEAIIFDMDGVLVDSSGVVWASFAKTLEGYGVSIQKSDPKRYAGKSLPDQLKMWEGENDIAPIPVEAFSQTALKYQLEALKERLKPDSGVQKLIREAKDKGIKIAVGTSSFRGRAITMLELVGVYQHLDGLTACEDVERHKPHPDVFLKAAETVGADPRNCVVIEDAVNGIQAAKAAGMKSAGKLGPHHTREELGIADLVFSDFEKIGLPDLEKLFS